MPMPAAAPAVTKFFPLSEVKRGMKGVAYTVFEGVNPEPMQVDGMASVRLTNSVGTGGASQLLLLPGMVMVSGADW